MASMELSRLYGPAQPRDRQVVSLKLGQIDYWDEVKPIFESRCVVCHACYDAPCQLKLGCIEGIERGASRAKVYDPVRLIEAAPTRLFEDAQTVQGWREKDFFPVLNEHDQTIAANRAAGLVYQMLQLKQAHPLPSVKHLGDEFEFSIDREHQCPKPEGFQQFASENPLLGMPYALPGISQHEQAILEAWLEQGAKYTAKPALSEVYRQQVARWEEFLNGDTNKQRLAGRYLFEHLFLAHLYFDNIQAPGRKKYFKLVRSSTPPGQPVRIIGTRRPYDDPLVDRVYYRLMEEREAIVAKTHMPYALNEKRMKFWRHIFIEREYDVDKLPDYRVEKSANPFVTFSSIPVTSRYEFLLDEAQYTVMGFIKGPVCRGQVALDVINDHFWVFFTTPDPMFDHEVSEFYAKNQDLLELPSAQGSTLRPLTNWRRYSKKQREYSAKRDHFFTEIIGKKIKYDLNLVWDGEGENDNAALTVFRHYDSATVEKGLVGPTPKTAWLIGYGQLERIHYLLVAGYDVYGNLGHQLLSRLYMDFLRMEGESGFLLLLPKEARDRERDYWYRGADPELMEYLRAPEFEAKQEPKIIYKTDSQKAELIGMLKHKLAFALSGGGNLASIKDPAISQPLTKLNNMSSDHLQLFPEQSLVLLETPDGDKLYTILRTSAHLNITSMFGEDGTRAPAEDTMMVLRGVVGAYPNEYFKVKPSELSDFVDQFIAVRSEFDYQNLRDNYGSGPVYLYNFGKRLRFTAHRIQSQ